MYIKIKIDMFTPSFKPIFMNHIYFKNYLRIIAVIVVLFLGFSNATAQYFPQPGDGPDVIAQKKRNRELVISSFADSAGPTIGPITSWLSITEHFDDFSKGIIDTKHVLYYLSLITFGLFLTAKSVDTERWRG